MMFLLILTSFLLQNDLDREIHSYLENHLKEYHSFRFQVLSEPDDYKEISVNTYGEFRMNKNLAYVPVTYTDTYNRNKNSVITVRLNLYDKVVVASRDLEREEVLDPRMLATRLVDITSLRGTPVKNIGEVHGALKYPVREGNVIIREYLRTVPVVKPGDKVNGIVKEGNVMITTDMFSRENGSVGEIIRVRSTDNKYFRARIIDNKNVLIIE